MTHSLSIRIRGLIFKYAVNLRYFLKRTKISLSTSVWIDKNGSVELGNRSRIAEHGKIFVHRGGKLIIGENTSIDRLCEIIVEENSILTIGDNSFIGSHSNIRVTGEMQIGSNCRVAQFVSLINGNYGYADKNILIKDQQYNKGFLFIKDDVWIGVASVVLPNVTVKKGAVVGAGCIISKDVEEYCVVVGNPQKIIRQRG